MKESIDKIIHAEEKAKEILEEASVFKQKTEEELKKLQEEIEDSVGRKTKQRVEADSAVKWKKLDSDIAERTESNQKMSESMDRYYKQHKDQWVSQIYSNIVKGGV